MVVSVADNKAIVVVSVVENKVIAVLFVAETKSRVDRVVGRNSLENRPKT